MFFIFYVFKQSLWSLKSAMRYKIPVKPSSPHRERVGHKTRTRFNPWVAFPGPFPFGRLNGRLGFTWADSAMWSAWSMEAILPLSCCYWHLKCCSLPETTPWRVQRGAVTGLTLHRDWATGLNCFFDPLREKKRICYMRSRVHVNDIPSFDLDNVKLWLATSAVWWDSSSTKNPFPFILQCIIFFREE